MKELTKETIAAVYAALKTATMKAYDAGEGAILAKASLESARTAMMLTGELVGKNEAEREAKARQAMSAKYELVEHYESESRRMRALLELARLDVEAVRAQLRLAELTAETAESR